MFDHFDLTDIGQKFITLSVENVASSRTYAFIMSSKAATGEAVRNYRVDEYFDTATIKYVATVHKRPAAC